MYATSNMVWSIAEFYVLRGRNDSSFRYFLNPVQNIAFVLVNSFVLMFTGKQASMRHRRRSSEPNVFNQAYKYDMDLTPGLTFSPPISSSMPMSHRGRGISNTDAYSILNSLRSDEDAATPRMHRRSSSGSSTYTDIPLEFFSYSETANVGIEFGLEGCAVCGMTTPGNKSYVNLKCRVLGCEHFAHKTCLSDPDASSHLLSMHSSLWFHAIGVGGIELEANRGSVEKIEVQIQLQILPLLSQCELQSYIGSSRDIRHHGQSQVVDHRMSPKPVLSLLRARLRFSFEWKGEQFVVEGNYDLTGLGNFESAKLVMVDSNSGNYLNVTLTRDLNGDWLICSARLEYGVVGSLGKRGRYLSNPETAKHSLSGSEPDRNRGLTVEESHLYNQINLLIGVEGSSLHHGLVSMDHEEYDSYNPDLAMVVEVMELDDIAMRQRKESVQEIFPQVAGRVRELACTQNGSRFLQDRIKDCDTQYINLIYREVKSGVVGLITDVFGNYLVQRLVESCQPSRRVEILKRMNRDMVLICCDRQGTRVLQKIIQGCESNDERSTITSSVGPSALKLMYDIHGSYVLNAMLDYFPLTELDFIIETAKCHMRSLAVNQHGLCVLKKILSNASEEWMRELCPFVSLCCIYSAKLFEI